MVEAGNKVFLECENPSGEHQDGAGNHAVEGQWRLWFGHLGQGLRREGAIQGG